MTEILKRTQVGKDSLIWVMPTLHQLSTFVAIVDEASFDGAARVLGISAPAVSQRIRALEEGLGRSLVVRTSPVDLTAAGERLLPYARRLVALAEDAAIQVRGGVRGETVTPISLAVNADSLATWFIDAMALYRGGSRAAFEIERGDENVTATALSSGRVAGAVTTQATPARGCTVRQLGAMRYLALASPDLVTQYQLLPDSPDLGPRLARAPFVQFDLDDPLQHDYLKSLGGDAPTGPCHRIPGSEAFGRAVEAGLGWGLVPEAQAKAAVGRGAVVLSRDRHVDVALYWQSWDLAPAPLMHFGDWLCRYAASRLRPIEPATEKGE